MSAVSAYKAVLFDKDGTLFSFEATWAKFCDVMFDRLAGADERLKQKLALACGYNLETRSFIAGSLIVNGSSDEVNTAWSLLVDAYDKSEIERINREIMYDLPLIPTCDLSAVMGALQARGLRLGVATNDFEAGAIDQLKRAKIFQYFDFICGSDSGYGRKPEPGMVDGFCKKIGVQPHEIIFVGDSKHDMDCGYSAGTGLCVAVLTGPANLGDLKEIASVVLTSIAELPAYLSAA